MTIAWNFNSKESTAAVIDTIALAATIASAGMIQAGDLYEAVCDRLTENQFETIITILISDRLVSRDHGHLLTWIGPKNSQVES